MSRGWRLLNEWMGGASTPASGGCWRPAADVYRAGRGWLVKFDLAGVNPTEVELRRQGNRLTVAGCRRDTVAREGLASFALEISYNRFERSVELPVPIDGLGLRTEYRDGMLLVWLT